MLPPKYTKSVLVSAQGGAVIVIARFASGKEGSPEEEERVEVLEGESHQFQERSEDMGSWQKVKEVLSIRAVDSEGGTVWEQDCKVDCEGVHGVLHYTIHATEGAKLQARDGVAIE